MFNIKQVQPRSLWQDMKTSTYLHCAAIAGFLLYAATMLWLHWLQTDELPQSEGVSIDVAFVPIKTQLISEQNNKKETVDRQKKSKDHNPVSRKSTVVHGSREMTENEKIQTKQLNSKMQSIAQASEIKPQQKPIVQRQVSRQSKQNVTGKDTKQSLSQSIRAQSQVIKNSTAQKTKVKNVASEASHNAQVLGAKKIKSSGLKTVKEGVVKAAKEKISSKEIKKPPTQTVQKQSKVVQQSTYQGSASNSAIEQNLAKQKQEAQMKKIQIEKKRLAEKVKKSEQEKRAAQIAKARAHEEAQTIARYGQMIIQHIQQFVLLMPGMDQLSAKLKVSVSLEGQVENVRLLRSSGSDSFDRLAINAVYKASPLPLPEDKVLGEKMATINLEIKPKTKI